MSPPWMPLYVADYIKDTGHLTAAEHGAYMLLIMHYWSTGALPQEDKRLASIARFSLDEWHESRATIAAFFEEGWRHPRIDRHLAEAEESYSRRAEAGRKGGKAKASGKRSSSNAKAELEALLEQSEPQPDIYSVESERERAAREREEREREFQRSVDEGFAEFYIAYPKRENRKDAAKRYETARRSKVEHSRIMAGLTRWQAKWSADGTDIQFIPAPDVWLNKRKYDDDPQPSARAGPLGRPSPSFHSSESRPNVPKTRSAQDVAREIAEGFARRSEGGPDLKLLA